MVEISGPSGARRQGASVTGAAAVLAGVLLLGASMECSASSVTLIWNGERVERYLPRDAHPLPAGSRIAVDRVGGHIVVSIATPGDRAPGGGGIVPPQDRNSDRIRTPNGQVIEIPRSRDVRRIDIRNGRVRVVYRDGATAEVDGEYLQPGAPSDPADRDGAFQSMPSGGLTPDEALAFAEEYVMEDWIDQFYGGPIVLSDFDYDFGGTELFPTGAAPIPMGTGLYEITYDSGESDRIVLSSATAVPEPAAFALWGASLLAMGHALRRARRDTRRGPA